MKSKKKTNNLITIILSSILTIAFLWFFLLPPTTTRSAHQRPFQPSRRNSGGSITRFDLRNITATGHALQNRERVLILTPVARWYDEYWTNLLKLTYPRELIDLGFIVPKGPEGDQVIEKLRVRLRDVQGKTGVLGGKFNHVTILRQDVEVPTTQDEKGTRFSNAVLMIDRHALEHQKARRATLSVARNSLLLTTLAPHIAWVLWLDADIIETPHSLIQDMTRHDRDIIVANAYQRYTDENGQPQERAYDFNSWIDSETSEALAAGMDDEDVLFEGYAEMATYRSLMAYIRNDERDKHEEIQLDGVGTYLAFHAELTHSTALMVKSAVHRDGATFPPFPFYHLLESEGFAKMARRLGYTCWGLPQYIVRLSKCIADSRCTITMSKFALVSSMDIAL
jgi:mannan polymerase complexes MNN9 subunit